MSGIELGGREDAFFSILQLKHPFKMKKAHKTYEVRISVLRNRKLTPSPTITSFRLGIVSFGSS
jgi:hypothetical protein